MTDESTPSRWDDFLDIFTSPATVFTRRRDGEFGLALMVFSVLMASLFFAFLNASQPIFDAEYTRGMAAAVKANPKLTPEMLESAKGWARGAMMVGGTLGGLLMGLFVGFTAWLAAKVAGSKLEFRDGMTIGTFAVFPRIIEAILNAAQCVMMDESSLTGRWAISFGPARFFDPDATSPILLAVVGRLDIFTLWVTVLIAVGAVVIGKVERNRAVLVGVTAWILGGLFPLWGAIRAS